MGTLQTSAFGHVADAASVYICGTFVVAVQRKSPKQPYDSKDLAETETVNSPQPNPATQAHARNDFSGIIRNARVGLSRNERSYGLLAPGHSPDLTISLAMDLTKSTTASRALSGGIRLDVQRHPVRCIGGAEISAAASWPLDIS